MRPRRASGRSGFTLIEVLVALSVLAIALGAAFRVAAAATRNSAEYRDRLLARWVAADVLAQARLERPSPEVGERTGEVEQAGLRFQWRRKVVATPNQRFRRVDVEVGLGGSDGPAMASLSGFAMAER